MKKTTYVEVNVGNKSLRIETGILAQQANGAVTVQLGDTLLFSAVTASAKAPEDIDYFPLQVEYREKFYASGQFPGGFYKREARPSEKEILTARFTDRPIRPLFQKGYRNEVQINNMLLSADRENDGDILSIVASSAALVISDLPFYGPIAAVRVGRIDGKFIINPTNTEREQSDLDLIYACNQDLPIMIEGDAHEINEADLVSAMKAAHSACKPIIEAQNELRQKLKLPNKTFTDEKIDKSVLQAATAIAETDLVQALTIHEIKERKRQVDEVYEKFTAKLLESYPDLSAEKCKTIFEQLETTFIRSHILEKKCRLDGRGFDEIRTLRGSAGLIPRAHGSALFQRGETQALAVLTLGSHFDTQNMDTITGGPSEKKFMVHYNFPPYSVGEVGRIGAVKRREVGHGVLAERSLQQMMPEDYPYTVRLVSEIMGSNGSTSMASVCAGTMALMDAGIKIAKHVAGISVGLVSDPKQSQLLVDITGEEDHYGDMDFKVAGTRDGITGVQLDLKINGVAWNLIEAALEKAHSARIKLIDFLANIIPEARHDLSAYAPRVKIMNINPEKIGSLIGPGGKNIRRITDLTGAQIDIEDDGTVRIFSVTADIMDMALREVTLATAEPEEGKIYNGRVTGIKDFGAFVEILPGKDGLVHISELADFRIKSVSDICKLGDQMWVKCIGIDDHGRIKLSRKAALKEKDATPA